MKNRIKELRNEKGLTLKEMSKDIGVSNNTISQYENGKRSPSIDMIFKIAKYFNVSIDELLDNNDYSSNIPLFLLFNREPSNDDYINYIKSLEGQYEDYFDAFKKLPINFIYDFFNWTKSNQSLLESEDKKDQYHGIIDIAKSLDEYIHSVQVNVDSDKNRIKINDSVNVNSEELKIMTEEFIKQSKRIGKENTKNILNIMKNMFPENYR